MLFNGSAAGAQPGMAFARGKGRAQLDPYAIPVAARRSEQVRRRGERRAMPANVDLKIAVDTGAQPHYGCAEVMPMRNWPR
jgi:hypothetical protein